MARVALLCPDLLFGSKVEGGLRAAGHVVKRYDTADAARAAAPGAELLVVDLTDDRYDGAALVQALRMESDLGELPVLGFYSHVDHEVRVRAEEAGFDRVVPRSRMAREMAALVDGMLVS